MRKLITHLLLTAATLIMPLYILAQDSSKVSMIPSVSVTQHQYSTPEGKIISYTATTGYKILHDEAGKAKAHIFFIAYTRNGIENKKDRPVTFTFNGGPGSSSIWLHMGGLGPKRIKMSDKGASLSPPYDLIDNPYSWLEFTDLVFIDPVETGYSRPAKGVKKNEFLGYDNDLQSVGQFIHRYLIDHQRWSSPKYLAGESYGTTRAAGLSNYLQSRYGLFLNGLVLISQVTNFQTIRFARGNDLPHILYLPTFAATAWYHGKLSSDFETLAQLLKEVEAFAETEYAYALMQGDELSEAIERGVVQKLARFTGLDTTYLRQTHLRLTVPRFNKELLRDQSLTVGRLDSRFKGTDYDDVGEGYEFDPSYSATIYGPFTTAFYEHVTENLGFSTELPYEVLTGRVRPWLYEKDKYLNAAEDMRKAMNQNPFLKVLICNGYYDLATPYFATEYTLKHMFLPKRQKSQITMKYYPAGHMVYIHLPSLVQMTKDVQAFYKP